SPEQQLVALVELERTGTERTESVVDPDDQEVLRRERMLRAEDREHRDAQPGAERATPSALGGHVEGPGCTRRRALPDRGPALGDRAAVGPDRLRRKQRPVNPFHAHGHGRADRGGAGWCRDDCGASRERGHSAADSEERLLIHESHPFPRGLSAFWSMAGLLADGPTCRAFPVDSWSSSGIECGWRPRSQWRVRAGFSPASHHHRPLNRRDAIAGSRGGVALWS